MQNCQNATVEEVEEALKTYPIGLNRRKPEHASTTQVLTQMAASRAPLGVLLCPNFIILFAIRVDLQMKGVRISAFASPALCRPRKGDARPYQVLLEAIQRAQQLQDRRCALFPASRRDLLQS